MHAAPAWRVAEPAWTRRWGARRDRQLRLRGPGGPRGGRPGKRLRAVMPSRTSDRASQGIRARWADALGDAIHRSKTLTRCSLPRMLSPPATTRSAGWCTRVSGRWRFKVVLPGGRLDSDRLKRLDARGRGVPHTRATRSSTQPCGLPRPSIAEELVAATKFKQRVRTMLSSTYHADRLHHAVVGTPNRWKSTTGISSKGRGGRARRPWGEADSAHLYK